MAGVRLVEIINPLIDASVGLGSEGTGYEGVILVVLFFVLILVIFLSFLALIIIIIIIIVVFVGVFAAFLLRMTFVITSEKGII